eukprot:6334513-Lingulodinium_polyedra.AAC.1
MIPIWPRRKVLWIDNPRGHLWLSLPPVERRPAKLARRVGRRVAVRCAVDAWRCTARRAG